MQFRRLLFLAIFISAHALARPADDTRRCLMHDPNAAGVPSCPTDSTLLTDNYYPAMAIAVSDKAGGAEYVTSFVRKVFQASGDKPPQILLSATGESRQKVLAEIQRIAPDEATARKWSDLIKPVGGSRYNWQQDYFQAFVNPETGRPVVREIEGYERSKRTGDLFRPLTRAADSACDIDAGEPILMPRGDSRDPDKGDFRGGNMGGNIEALPGNLCVVGEDHFENWQYDQFTSGICKSENLLKAPTRFLAVGHTDEIMTSVKIPGASAPCDFAVLVASPRAGLEALRANPQDSAFGSGPEVAERIQSYGFWRRACNKHFELRSRQRRGPTQGQGDPEAVSWLNVFLPQAFAIDVIRRDATDPSRCPEMTNANLLRALESDPQFKQYNDAVQADLDKFKVSIRARLKERLPSCEPKILDVPDIFMGELVEDERTGALRPAQGRGQSGHSLFSNPTNSVQIENTLIVPTTHNKAFNDMVSAQLQALGVKTDFIDTTFAHRNMGNLHCSSNVMRYCKPAGGAR